MSIVSGFFRFLYDFIVGDAWEIAAGIVLALVLGVLALRSGAVPADVLPVVVGGAIVLVVVLSLVWEAQRRIRAAR